MWGIYDRNEKRFIFGIAEETRAAADKAFRKRSHEMAYSWRYETKKIPEGWVNPANPRYRRNPHAD